MADDPFSIWGDPQPSSDRSPAAVLPSSSPDLNAATSADTLNLEQGHGSLTSPPNLFQDDLSALDPAWDTPVSPPIAGPVVSESLATSVNPVPSPVGEALAPGVTSDDLPPLAELTDKLSIESPPLSYTLDVAAAPSPEGMTPTTQSVAAISVPTQAPASDDAFPDDDDFDDFGDATQGGEGGANDDDFGGFGDFDEGPNMDEPLSADLDPTPAEQPAAPLQETTLQPCLPVIPSSTGAELTAGIRDILRAPLAAGSPSYPFHDGAEGLLGKEELRQVEGLSQVLVTEGSRKLWATLSELPTVKPVDWTRSRTRREQLISLGIPINLDEVRDGPSRPGGVPRGLPPLKLQLDSASTPRESGPSSAPSERTTPKRSVTALPTATRDRVASSTQNTPRSGSPAPGVMVGPARLAQRRREELGLGVPPEMAWDRAEEVIAMNEEHLSLQSVAYLRALSRELHSLTTTASSLLTHHLTLRESHAADAEMYNTMIRDLVAGATSRFSGAGGSGGAGSKKDDRRATVIGAGSHPRGATGGR